MRSPRTSRMSREQGFSLIEVLIALAITLVVMAAVFMLLQKGQNSFRREPEVADMNQSARVGLDMISRDLIRAGYQTPPAMAILWADGGGIDPDQLTIVYADDQVPISIPLQCGSAGGGSAYLDPGALPAWAALGRGAGLAMPNSPTDQDTAWWSHFPTISAAFFQWGGGRGGRDGGSGGGPCNTIGQSATLNIEPDSLDPAPADPTQAYARGMTLMAIETADCNGDGQIGAIPFEVTQDPRMTSAGGSPTLQINHNPGNGSADINRPGGFNGEVHPDCAIIGLFRIIQYRVNPPPPTDNPLLERRDLSIDSTWTPVSNNIENLQVQYGIGSSTTFVDNPAQPNPDDPNTWITRVRVTVAGRSQSTNLQGATAGVFAAEDTHLRKTFSTVVSLRNQVYAAADQTDNANYN